MHSCTHPISDLLCYSAEARLRICYSGHLPPDQVGRKALNFSRVQLKCLRDFIFEGQRSSHHPLSSRASAAYECFNEVCQDFGHRQSEGNTGHVSGGFSPPVIRISDYELEVVHYFAYLGSTISDCLSLDTELNKRIGKAATYLDSQKLYLHAYRRVAYKKWGPAYLKSRVLRTFSKSKFTI